MYQEVQYKHRFILGTNYKLGEHSEHRMVISTIFKNNLTIICTKKSYTYYLYWVYENDNSYKLFTEQLYARYLPFFQTQPLCSPVYQESIQIITIGLLGTNVCIGLLGTLAMLLTRIAPFEVASRLQTGGGNCFAIRV